MKCAICKTGETLPGKTTVTLQRENTLVVIKEVPGEICAHCGEYYLNETTSKLVMDQAEAASARHAEVEIMKYAAQSAAKN